MLFEFTYALISRSKMMQSTLTIMMHGLGFVCVRCRVALVGRGIILAPFAKAGGVMGCGVV